MTIIVACSRCSDCGGRRKEMWAGKTARGWSEEWGRTKLPSSPSLLLIIFLHSLTLHHTIWTSKRLLSHAALSPSKIKFTVSYRSFMSKPNPPALSGSCKFIEGFSRYFLAPFMASFVNKEAFLPAGFQVRFMKHPLSCSHRSQVLFIPFNKPKTCLKRCWWLLWVQGSYKKLQLFLRTFQGPPIRNVISQIGLHKNAHSQSNWTGLKAWTICSTNVFTFFHW